MKEYTAVFNAVFEYLERSSNDKKAFWNKIQELNNYKARYRKMSDKEIFSKLVEIVFFSGIKARVVESRLPEILEKLGDPEVTSKYSERDVDWLAKEIKFKNKNKIKACIENAKKFETIVRRYGSFADYLDYFGVDVCDSEGINRKLVPALKKFKYIKGVTVYHFLMDIGFFVMKPDRTICRLFHRLGWVDRSDEQKVIEICRKISEETGYWIRVVDITFAAFCQEGGMPMLGIEDGVCKNTPKCSICPVNGFCHS